MTKRIYKVIEGFDSSKHTEVTLTKMQSKCMNLLKKGEVFEPKNLINDNIDTLSTFTAKDKHNAVSSTVFTTLSIAKGLGIIKEVNDKPISFENFIQQDSIQYFADQLRGSKNKNIKESRKLSSTKKDYLYRI